MRPSLARLTLARKIAAITLIIWRKEQGPPRRGGCMTQKLYEQSVGWHRHHPRISRGRLPLDYSGFVSFAYASQRFGHSNRLRLVDSSNRSERLARLTSVRSETTCFTTSGWQTHERRLSSLQQADRLTNKIPKSS
jgi:hypothetical protein